ncbi:MAG: fibronectin type III domain-containing protein [Gammaproteobacteria bacterium]
MFTQSVSLHAAEIPILESNKNVAEAGFFKLTWQESLGEVEIEEAMNRDFSDANKLYPGSDNATVISGKPNGEWYYRARLIDDGQAGGWSDAIQVTVEHHSLERALYFFFAGLIMFVATCWLVIRGERLA